MRSFNFKLYSPQASERIITEVSGWIDTLSERYPIPAACVKAILYQELTQVDVLDILADLAVQVYWLRYSLRQKLGFRDPAPRLRRGVFGKRDSSTGYAQIFACVGINAVNFALSRGLADPAALRLPAGHALSPDRPEDLRTVWTRLHRDTRFNIELATLNLLSAAEEMTGRIDFPHYAPEEWKLVLTRYNAKADHVTAYGEAAYRHYLRYAASAG